MKKIMILLGASFLFAAASAYAAEPYVGVTAGVNIANLTDNNDGSIMRFNAGVLGGYKFGRFFALQGELAYSCNGTNIADFKVGNETVNDVHLNLNYINIPITAKFFITRKLNIFAGGQVGFLVSKKYNDHGDKSKADFDANKVDFSIPMGVGLDFTNFMISARYQKGVVNVFKNETLYGNGRNSVISINIGYKFQSR